MDKKKVLVVVAALSIFCIFAYSKINNTKTDKTQDNIKITKVKQKDSSEIKKDNNFKDTTVNQQKNKI
jgi:hypothetical protein